MLTVDRVTVRYGDLVAVDDVSLSAGTGEVVAVLGPSGCGKSTLLRAIAGLEPVVAGRIAVGGEDLGERPPERRDVGLAFQEGALFPHRTVAENIAFGPRMRGWPRDRICARVAEVLDLVDLAGHGHRAVTELSGGEAQRVALARAVAPRPTLLMLDEPLGALDRGLRDRLVDELPRVFADLDATVLYVTHDQDEALTLADRVAVMARGRIQQVGTPEQLWRTPADVEVARFLGLDQLIAGEVVEGGVVTVFGRLTVPVGELRGDVVVLVLPDAVAFAPPGEGHPATIAVRGTVSSRRFAGDHLVVDVATDAGPHLRVPTRVADAPHVGASATVTVDPTAVRVLPPPDEGVPR
jgi:thiamine transport system ATP-binding protein